MVSLVPRFKLQVWIPKSKALDSEIQGYDLSLWRPGNELSNLSLIRFHQPGHKFLHDRNECRPYGNESVHNDLLICCLYDPRPPW